MLGGMSEHQPQGSKVMEVLREKNLLWAVGDSRQAPRIAHSPEEYRGGQMCNPHDVVSKGLAVTQAGRA